MEEIWKIYKGLIEVSNIGNVKSLDRVQVQNNRWGKTMLVHHKGQEIHPYLSKTGYYKIVICNGKEKEYQNVHRLVALLFCKIPEELKNIPLSKLHIDHIDGNKTNNIYTNLRWVTPKQNTHNPITFEKWKEIIKSEEYKEKLKKSLLDRDWKPSEEQKRKISEANKGRKLSKEQIEKMSQRMKELLKDKTKHPMYGKKGKNSPNFGKHLSEETKRKISEANKGKVVSEETRQKLIARKFSEETRAKMSAAKKGKLGNRRKEVVQLNSENKLMAIFKSATDAEKELGIKQSSISACCRGKAKSAGGSKWMFKKDYDKIQ